MSAMDERREKVVYTMAKFSAAVMVYDGDLIAEFEDGDWERRTELVHEALGMIELPDLPSDDRDSMHPSDLLATQMATRIVDAYIAIGGQWDDWAGNRAQVDAVVNAADDELRLRLRSAVRNHRKGIVRLLIGDSAGDYVQRGIDNMVEYGDVSWRASDSDAVDIAVGTILANVPGIVRALERSSLASYAMDAVWEAEDKGE